MNFTFKLRVGAVAAGMLVLGCKIPSSPIVVRVDAIHVAPARLSLVPFQAAPLTIAVSAGHGDGTGLLQWSTTGGSIINNGNFSGVLHITYSSPAQPGDYLLVVTTAIGVPADTAHISVTATPVPVHTVTVTPASISIVVGDTTRFSTTLADSTGSALFGRAITWSLSDSTKATIAGSGFVHAIAAGTTTVIATSEGRSGTAVLTVNAGP
jgi:Big-like domain-containing protein